MLRPIWILIYLLAIGHGYAQKFTPELAEPITEGWRYSQIEAMSGKGVRTLFIDSEGGYWFGINDGIAFYDGYNFQIHDEKTGLASGPVYQIAQSSQGLIAVQEESVSFLNKEGKWQSLFQVPAFLNGTSFRFSSTPAPLILVHSQGFYVISASEDIHIYAPESHRSSYNLTEGNTFHPFDNLVSDPNSAVIDDIIKTKSGKYWMACMDGKRDDIIEFELDRQFNIVPKSGRSLSSQYQVRFGEGQQLREMINGDIWAINTSTDIGVMVLENNSWREMKMNPLFGEDEYHHSITQLHDGKIVIGGLGLVYQYHNRHWIRLSAPDHDIPASQINVYSSPHSPELWIVGLQSKAYRVDMSLNHWTTFNALNFQDEDQDGKRWFMHRDGYIVCEKDGNWKRIDSSHGIIDTPVKILVTRQNQVWVAGSHQGIAATSYLSGDQWIREYHEQLSWGIDFRSAFEDKKGNLWFGAGVDYNRERGQLGGVLQLRDPSGPSRQWVHHQPGENGLDQSNVYGIAQSDDGNIWIGGTNLTTYDGKKWSRSGNAQLNNFVNIVASNGCKLLVGSRYYGLHIYDDENWKSYLIDDGLLSNTITEILPVKSGIYVGTDKDISFFDGKIWINNILPQEISIRNEGGSLKISGDGSIWVNQSKREWKRRALIKPSEKAFSNFRTVRYTSDRQAPQTWVEIYDDEVDDSGNTFISWGGRDYLYQTSSKDLQYSYRLNDNEWSPYSNNTHITLSGLKDGSYFFEVKARDLDLNEDITPVSIQFDVMPPVWKQQWFILMVLAFIIVIAVFEARIINKNSKLATLNRELESHQRELEANNLLLGERNLEIGNQRDRLQKLIKRNEALSKAKLQFFTNITHEFRTPLTLISGPIQQLRSKKLTDREQSLLFDIVTKNINRLQKLINQLLEFRKTQASSLELFLRKSDVISFIRETSVIFENLASQKDIHFSISTSQPHFQMYFDQDKLEKIIYNLLSNAFKYTRKEGTVELAVETSERQGFISIRIKDTGIGMSDEVLSNVFSRFRTEQGQEDSMGIGLAYTRELIQKHRGSIDIVSVENEGTAVNVCIPINLEMDLNVGGLTFDKSTFNLDTQAGLKDKNLRLLVESRVNKREGIYKILLVEDNEDMRDFLTVLLSNQYQVLEANDARQALSILKQEKVDLILSDVMMPEIDGLTLCEKVKAGPETSHIPVILLTAKFMDEDIRKGYYKGADDYIVKPFEPDVLLLKIRNILNSQQALKNKMDDNRGLNPKEIKLESSDDRLLKRLTQIMEENISDSEFDVNRMCELVNLSHIQFIRKIKQLTGKKPVEILKSFRLKRAKQLLAQNKANVSEVAYMVGYDLPNSFSRAFKQEFGYSPSEFVRQEQKEISL